MPTPTYEHVVATAHRINNEAVTADTDLTFLDDSIEREGAHAFNNAQLARDDFFSLFSDDVFDFRELEDSQDSVSTICIFFKKK